jgi:hypothetical protein
MSNKEAIKELRCLRMHLLPILQRMEVLEKKLEKNGAVSTDPETTSSFKDNKLNQQGKRTTKKQAYSKYLNK